MNMVHGTLVVEPAATVAAAGVGPASSRSKPLNGGDWKRDEYIRRALVGDPGKRQPLGTGQPPV